MDVFNLMKAEKIDFLDGLSINEIQTIEKYYKIKFPYSLKQLFLKGIPISDGFYHWNDFSKSNVNKIKKMLALPVSFILEHIEELEWLKEYEFPSASAKLEFSHRALQKAPLLIPIYGHRYIPLIDSDDPPILSVHGFDIIYYGMNLFEWVEIEFGKKSSQITSLKNYPFVPFWTEIC